MRIRQVKPEFWADSEMAGLSFRARLTFIGLWGIADDAGWLPKVNPTEIGHALWGYDGVRVRERWVIEDLTALQAIGCIAVLDCGHATIPSLPVHQCSAAATRRVEAHRKDHLARCAAASDGAPLRSAASSGSPLRSAPVRNGKGRNGKGTERNGTVAGAGAETTTETEFSQLVPRPS